jgi:hypothetical protein
MVYGAWGIHGAIVTSASAVLLWLLVALRMAEPRYLSSYVLPIKASDAQEANALQAALAAIRGVADAAVAVDEGVAYLKIDRAVIDETELRAFARPTNEPLTE